MKLLKESIANLSQKRTKKNGEKQKMQPAQDSPVPEPW
jgi:hypothetical protein